MELVKTERDTAVSEAKQKSEQIKMIQVLIN